MVPSLLILVEVDAKPHSCHVLPVPNDNPILGLDWIEPNQLFHFISFLVKSNNGTKIEITSIAAISSPVQSSRGIYNAEKRTRPDLGKMEGMEWEIYIFPWVPVIVIVIAMMNMKSGSGPSLRTTDYFLLLCFPSVVCGLSGRHVGLNGKAAPPLPKIK